MYTDSTLQPIYEHLQYIAPNGKQYSKTYPKNLIPDVFPVVPADPITDATLKVIGFHIEESEGVYTQVFDTEEKTEQDLADDLLNAKQGKMSNLYSTYVELREASIEFTTDDDVTKMFQADKDSTYAIQGMLDTYTVETPEGFYWVSEDNTRVMPFLLVDLQGLANVIGVRATGLFQHLQDKKELVLAATTIAEVDAITW